MKIIGEVRLLTQGEEELDLGTNTGIFRIQFRTEPK